MREQAKHVRQPRRVHVLIRKVAEESIKPEFEEATSVMKQIHIILKRCLKREELRLKRENPRLKREDLCQQRETLNEVCQLWKPLFEAIKKWEELQEQLQKATHTIQMIDQVNVARGKQTKKTPV